MSSFLRRSFSRCTAEELAEREPGEPPFFTTGPRPRGVPIGTLITVAELLSGVAGAAGRGGPVKVPGATHDSIDPPSAADSSVEVIGVVDVADTDRVSELISRSGVES